MHFEERTQACAWLDDAFGFQPREMPERRSVLKAAARNALKSPFHVMPLVRDKAYLDYDPKAEYEKVLQGGPGTAGAVGDLINRRAISTGCGEGGPIWSASVPENWMPADPTQETIFTVTSLGCGCAQWEGTLGSKGSHERRCSLLAADWPSDQRL